MWTRKEGLTESSQRLLSGGFIRSNVGWKTSPFFGLIAVKAETHNKHTFGSRPAMTPLQDAFAHWTQCWLMFTCRHRLFSSFKNINQWMTLSSGPFLSTELNGFVPTLFCHTFASSLSLVLLVSMFCPPFTPLPLFVFCAPQWFRVGRLFSVRTKQPKAEWELLGLCQSQGSDWSYKSGWKDWGSWIPSVWPQLNTRSPIKRDAQDQSIKPRLPSDSPCYWQGQLIHR